uniref:Uncharacterized protein n=1 Tax=Anguilla anguilla TaxID=7936 RepID=A0A0E9WSN5_ANGAN
MLDGVSVWGGGQTDSRPSQFNKPKITVSTAQNKKKSQLQVFSKKRMAVVSVVNCTAHLWPKGSWVIIRVCMNAYRFQIYTMKKWKGLY